MNNLPGPEAEDPLSRKTASQPSDRLESWKEIASYLRRDVRTVQRWEKREGLPVHRHQHDERASVFAYKAELDAWWHNGQSRLEKENGGEGLEEESFGSTSAASNGQSRATDKADPMSRVGPGWRLWLAGAFMVLLASTVVAIYMLHHAQTPALNFHPRDMVLIASFENRTGNPLLDGTLEAALEGELTNSQFVSVVPRVRVNDTLALMRKPPDTPVDAALGREICLRDGGIRALATGRVEKFGSTYVLSTELIDPWNGRAVASFKQEARGQTGILPAVRRLSNQLRLALGESLSQIRKSDLVLQKVTTPSLKALQLYSRANETLLSANVADSLLATMTDYSAAFELLKQAIADDPDFASAYILAAWSLHNMGKSPDEYLSYAKRALKLSEQASAPERYFIEGSYYQMSGESDRAIAAYQALLQVDPRHFWAMNNLAALYGARDQVKDSVETQIRLARLRPNDYNANWLAGYSAAILGKNPGEARPYFDRSHKLFSAMTEEGRAEVADRAVWLQLFPASQAWMKDDVASASKELERAEKRPVAPDPIGNPRNFGLFELTLGRTRHANAWFRDVATTDPFCATATCRSIDRLIYEQNFALLYFIRGDHSALRRSLRRIARLPDAGWLPVSLMIEEHLFREAEAALKRNSPPSGIDAPRIKLEKGELLVARGKIDDGMALIQESVAESRNLPNLAPYYFWGTEVLARTYEKQGSLSDALNVLEDASANRSFANMIVAMIGAPFWMRDQMDLARLYRRMGRVKDAQKIEVEMRNLLAYADPDFPMLVELKKLENSPRATSKEN